MQSGPGDGKLFFAAGGIKGPPLPEVTLGAHADVLDVVLHVDGHLFALENEPAPHLAGVADGFAPAGADGLHFLNGVGQLHQAGGPGEPPEGKVAAQPVADHRDAQVHRDHEQLLGLSGGEELALVAQNAGQRGLVGGAVGLHRQEHVVAGADQQIGFPPHPQPADQLAAAFGVHLRFQDQHPHPLFFVVVRNLHQGGALAAVHRAVSEIKFCHSIPFVGSIIAQTVAQTHEAVAEVDVFHHGVGVGHRQIVVGKVPEPPDAQLHQPAADLLGPAAGEAQHRHLGVALAAEVLQAVQGTDGDAADGLAHQGGVDVKRGDQCKAIVVVGDKAADGGAQPAAAQQDGGQVVASAKEQPFQDGQQFVHRIADALPAVDVADAVEILADLGGGGAHLRSKLPGGDAVHTGILEGAQVAVIFGQAPDDRHRSLGGWIHDKTSSVCGAVNFRYLGRKETLSSQMM